MNLPPERAFELFTPSGERLWAGDEWDPQFPRPVSEETDPATVFEVTRAGVRSTWIVATSDPGRAITYAQVVPGSRAGLISVAFSAAGEGRTDAHVTYAMTPLSGEGEAQLGEFQRSYQTFLAHWETSIAKAVEGDTRLR